MGFGHAVGHDAERGDAEVVEADDIVGAFDEDEAVLGDELAIAGFAEAAGVLAEEFLASMEAFREAVFGGRFLGLAFGGGEGLVLAFFLFVLHIAAHPREDFALF